MPRARKNADEPVVKEDLESEEFELDSEESDEELLVSDAETASGEKEKKPSTPKARRKRSPRKKASAPNLFAGMSSPVEENEAPTKLKASESVVSPTRNLQLSLESMAKQWAEAKDVSTSVVNSLERVNTILHTMPSASAESRPVPSGRSLAQPITVGVSLASLFLSLVSLSLSQSLRQAALEKQVAQAPIPVEAKHVAAPIEESAPIPKKVAHPPAAHLAVANRPAFRIPMKPRRDRRKDAK